MGENDPSIDHAWFVCGRVRGERAARGAQPLLSKGERQRDRESKLPDRSREARGPEGHVTVNRSDCLLRRMFSHIYR